METSPISSITTSELVAVLEQPDAFPNAGTGPVELVETHISCIFLAGDFAYKVKKPVKTPFLDYTNLAERERFCHEELRLDRRYAGDLYVGVVPITWQAGQVRVEGKGTPIEYAVKMRRFDSQQLMSEQVKQDRVTFAQVQQVAISIADFHALAAPQVAARFGTPDQVRRDANDNLGYLQDVAMAEQMESLARLQQWTDCYFSNLASTFQARLAGGFIRECHGDLHLANIIRWQGRFLPFDGIEFNESFRWIDILSDAAFLAMDLAAYGRADLQHWFINAYLEQTADRDSLRLLRWYMVYRALVRAKVAAIRTQQLEADTAEAVNARKDCQTHVALADRLTSAARPRLMITHGVSGSGKTVASESVVLKTGAIRLRSDVERKRLVGLASTARPTGQEKREAYSAPMTDRTYAKLLETARHILNAGYSVLIDAAFLKQQPRHEAKHLANSLGVDFAILACDADKETLRQRIGQRMAANSDASDADLDVLESQLATREPLTESEQAWVVRA